MSSPFIFCDLLSESDISFLMFTFSMMNYPPGTLEPEVWMQRVQLLMQIFQSTVLSWIHSSPPQNIPLLTLCCGYISIPVLRKGVNKFSTNCYYLKVGKPFVLFAWQVIFFVIDQQRTKRPCRKLVNKSLQSSNYILVA